MTPQRLQPVRVLFIDHVPRLSGAEQSLLDLVAGLRGPIEPVVVLPSDGPLAAELRAQGVLVRMVPMSRRMLETSRRTLASRPFTALAQLGAFLAASWRLFRLVREVRPRIVHTNTLKAHLLAIVPCTLARVPLVWHLRDILPEGWLRRALLACARSASAIIVPSRAVAEPFRGRRRTYRKLRLIPNGIRVEDFQDARADRSLRDMLGVGAQDPVVGIVGRIAPWKGQDVLLRAAGMLAARYPRARFAVIGSVLFPENDEPYERALHGMALDLGLEGRVAFLGWQPAPEAMAACDVIVHASLEPEPFGRAIVEAMATGRPVVAAAGGAVAEILPPSAGFIVAPGRPELLADALDRLLADRKLRRRMGEAGAAIADSFFRVERTVQSVGLLYRSLAATTRAPRRALVRRRPRAVPQTWQRPAAEGRTDWRARMNAGARGTWSTPEGANPAPASRSSRPSHGPRPTPKRAVARTITIDLEHDDLRALPDEDQPRRAPRAGRRASATAVRLKSRPLSGAQEAAVAVLPHAPPLVLAPAPAPDVGARKPLYDAAKRAIDVIVALAVLAVGLPLWILVAVLIKLDSRGPVLHRGRVHGRGCAPFTYYKFRSMRVDGDDAEHRTFIQRYVRENGGHEANGTVVYKLVGDDRVTAVGRLIRALSIDEIPQFLNVLRGEMSIVGPRPPLDYEYDLYDGRAKTRLSVLPGITGLQQVEARHEASFEDKLRMDLDYIARRSVPLDLALILRTIPAAIRGH